MKKIILKGLKKLLTKFKALRLKMHQAFYKTIETEFYLKIIADTTVYLAAHFIMLQGKKPANQKKQEYC